MRRIPRYIKLSLHPRRDADVIKFLGSIDKGEIAQTVIDALRALANDAQPAPARPIAKPTPKTVGSFVSLDDSEGFN